MVFGLALARRGLGVEARPQLLDAGLFGFGEGFGFHSGLFGAGAVLRGEGFRLGSHPLGFGAGVGQLDFGLDLDALDIASLGGDHCFGLGDDLGCSCPSVGLDLGCRAMRALEHIGDLGPDLHQLGTGLCRDAGRDLVEEASNLFGGIALANSAKRSALDIARCHCHPALTSQYAS